MSTTKLIGRENLTKYAFWLGSVGPTDKENQVKMYKKHQFRYITLLKRQGSGSNSWIRIRIKLKITIRIHIKVKSGIQIRNRIKRVQIRDTVSQSCPGVPLSRTFGQWLWLGRPSWHSYKVYPVSSTEQLRLEEPSQASPCVYSSRYPLARAIGWRCPHGTVLDCIQYHLTNGLGWRNPHDTVLECIQPWLRLEEPSRSSLFFVSSIIWLMAQDGRTLNVQSQSVLVSSIIWPMAQDGRTLTVQSQSVLVSCIIWPMAQDGRNLTVQQGAAILKNQEVSTVRSEIMLCSNF